MPQVFAICVSPSLRAPLKSTKTHGFMICSTFKRHLWHKSSRCVIWDPCPTSATNCHPQTWFFRIASSLVFNVFGQKLVACWRWEATAAARFVGICSCRIHDWGQCAAQERADVSIWIAQKATPIEKTMQDWWLMMTACLHLAFQIYIYIVSPAIPSIYLFLDVSCLCAEEDTLRFQRTGSQSLIECPDWCPHVCWLPAICQWTIGNVSKKRETTSNCQVKIT